MQKMLLVRSFPAWASVRELRHRVQCCPAAHSNPGARGPANGRD